MEASQEGHLELVRYLLEARADVNATTGIIYRERLEYFQHSAQCCGSGKIKYFNPKKWGF
jgi:hypothetical protein